MVEGDRVRLIVAAGERNWGFGKNERTGKFGTFPLNKLNANVTFVKPEDTVNRKGKDD